MCIRDSGDDARFGDGRDQGIHTLLADRAVGFEVAHEAEHRAGAARGERPAAGVYIGDQQVNRVRADVEYSEAHAASVAADGVGAARLPRGVTVRAGCAPVRDGARRVRAGARR